MQAKNGECKPLGVCDTCDPSAGVSFLPRRHLVAIVKIWSLDANGFN